MLLATVCIEQSLELDVPVDVFHGGKFWQATVIEAEKAHVKIHYAGGLAQDDEWISRDSYLSKWRFPLR